MGWAQVGVVPACTASSLAILTLALFQMDLDEDTAERFYHSLLELDTHVRAALQGTGAQS